MKITFVAVSVPALQQVKFYEKRFHKKYPNRILEINYFYVAGIDKTYLRESENIYKMITESDIAVIDTMGASEELQDIVRRGLEQCCGNRIIIGNTLREYLKLGSFSMSSMGNMMKKKTDGKTQKRTALDKMRRMRRMALMLGNALPFGVTKDMKNVFLLMDYWQQGTEQDITSFMRLILRQYGGQKDLPKELPCSMNYGIYLKDIFSGECMDTVGDYIRKNPFIKSKETVAVLFYGHSYPNDFMPIVKAVINEFKRSYNVLPVAFSQNDDEDLIKLEKILCQNTHPVSAVINLMPFRLGAGPMGGDAQRAVGILKKLDVPYFKPFALTKVTEEEWTEADAVNPGEFLISIMLPEMDGGICTFPVGVMSDICEGKREELPSIIPMDERVSCLYRRVDRYIKLRNKDNNEKKLAVIFYNYPPGEDNILSSAFLDTLKSASILLERLMDEGYCTEKINETDLLAFFTDGRCNNPAWSDIEESEITYRYEDGEYQIRGMIRGNIFLGLQPLRGGKEEELVNYHDKNQAPDNEYQAFYRWLNEEFHADAVLHFGTHGTLEFLPGKENGMTGKCWPDKLIGDVPHFYFYYIGNPSEAMIAKRRSMAELISYEAPTLSKSGLEDDYVELKEMIAEYRESLQSSPERCNDLLNQIEGTAKSRHLIYRESETETDDTQTEKMLNHLEETMYEYENSLITEGLHVMNETECRGIIHALNGGYLEAGPGGDVIKNPKILPAGRNLIQFDPRLIPTRTACERGFRAAEMCVKEYRKRTGKYPGKTAVILWGLETSRSQGETIGQIMYYLGLRLKTEKSSYDDRMEIIPIEELGRPRIDVIIHMCGFFRDMYPNIIDDLNEMMHQLLNRNETDEQNYYSANVRSLIGRLKEETEDSEDILLDKASCRIFGPKQGEYGSRLPEIVRKGEWRQAEEIGSTFTEELCYGYSYRMKGIKDDRIIGEQYNEVDFISQVRNNIEYEMTDLDHYYEFYGGLSKAIENRKGEKPVMLVADTTGRDVKVQGIEEAVNRGVVTKIINEKWIDSMMRHDYHGVQQIEKRFENIMGFAASADAVESQVFSELTECYVRNKELRDKMQKSNRWAYMKMMERLMEANNRGYYDADEEELDLIREAYLEAEGEAEK